MKVKINRVIVSLAVLTALILPTTGVYAQSPSTSPPAGGSNDKCGGGITFFPAWYDGLCDPATGEIKSPSSFNKNDTASSFGQWLTIIALNLVSMLLYAVGYVSLGFIIFGGFKYMTSGDNSAGTAAARKTITNAVIGLVLSIMSVALVTFIAGAIK